MRRNSGFNRLLTLLTLMALPFLVGSSCFFAFSSGGSGGAIVKDDDDDDEEEETGFVQTGTFSSPATEGINYKSASLAGVTGRNGAFEYMAGETVQFFIGDIPLGSAVTGKSTLSPQDLVADGAGAAAAATNISRLLHSLDAEPDDEVVTIPTAVRSAAVHSNPSVSAAIEFLDFSDEDAFTNAASQLVSVLTDDYPHTATLIDADSVQDRETAVRTYEQER